MLSLVRQCRASSLLPVARRILVPPKNNCPQYGAIRNYMNPAWRRQPLSNIIKSRNLLKVNSGPVLLRLSSNIPQKAKKVIGYWLLSCSGMVFVAVVLGGVTRLTESGLSMVTWKLLGEKMPRTQQEWEEEFKKYQQYPEFKIKNREMTLSEFKYIWHMEFAHRMWGRLIGAFFALPAAYFYFRGYLTPPLRRRVLLYGALLAGQGLLGWYMVQSGLEDRFQGPNDVPRVSQYRLAGHLALALTLYAFMLRGALHLLLPAEAGVRGARGLATFAHYCKGMVFFTAVSGAFVAGLDAGLVYNSFPMMADRWIPEDLLALSPKLANVTENPTMVQFDHRVLGTVTLAMVTGLYWASRKRVLPRRAHLAAGALVTMAWLQVGLGITTLLTYVPTSLAACHQSGSLLLLSMALWFTHELKKLPK